MYSALIFTGMSSNKTLQTSISLGAYRIRTVLEENGYPTKVIDHFESLTLEDITKCFERYVSKNLLFVGISSVFLDETVFTSELVSHLIELKKKYKVKFVSGHSSNVFVGPEAKRFASELIDFQVFGYADKSVLELCKKLQDPKHKLIYNPGEPPRIMSDISYMNDDVSNVKTIWKPEDNIQSYNWLPIEISRGCIFRCSFCSFSLNGKKKFDYIRAKESLAEEFIRNYEQFGVTSYQFMDDTFNDSLYKLEFLLEITKSLPFKLRFNSYIRPELIARWPEQAQLLSEVGLRGAACGIESLKPDTRTAIKRLANTNKILEALENLKSASKGEIKIHGNFIVGLPFMSKEDILTQRKEIIKNSHILDSWLWNAFVMRDKAEQHPSHLSLIDISPGEYGYEPQDGNIVNWKNEFMNFEQSKKLTSYLTNMDKNYQKVASWMYGSIQNSGVDPELHYKNHNGYLHKLNKEYMVNFKKNSIDSYRKINI